MEFYIYFDADHFECEIFDSLEKAKAYAEQQWPDASYYGFEWEESEDQWSYAEYVTLFKRKVNEQN